jgi:hypothetical protein
MKNSLSDIGKHALIISSALGSTFCCKQLYSLMKNIKSRIRMNLTDEYLEGCILIATEIKPDIDQWKVSLIMLFDEHHTLPTK